MLKTIYFLALLVMVGNVDADDFLTDNDVYFKYKCPVDCSSFDKGKGLSIVFDKWNFVEFSEDQ